MSQTETIAPAMSPKQREMARHALGLPNKKRTSYRNRYVVDGGSDHDEWCALVKAGLARMRKGNEITGGMDCFWLTEAGARLALNSREKLDAEDFQSRAKA